jgi:hypothetical protein
MRVRRSRRGRRWVGWDGRDGKMEHRREEQCGSGTENRA